ncbi:MAG: hypothetical protein KAJ18_11580 [Candidatus Omnitrophica bacterium]|nr:hypothetical protein [Candidatus Omnitrophota bacterium]
MSDSRDRKSAVLRLLRERKIADLEELKSVLGTNVRMTAFRTLQQLEYLSSYSHRGQFYTLFQIPQFDENGLWSFQSIRFSRYGNLLSTTKAFVEKSEDGYTATELENVLHVEVKHPLLQLTKQCKLYRLKIGRSHVYMSVEKGKQRQQRLRRENRQAYIDLGMGLTVELLPDEAKAAIILFFSMLNEKQRRLYAGLEAAKLGHGGDRRIADFLGLEVHTVAKGRKELLGGSIDRNGVRSGGGGRDRVEKKIQP